MREDLPTATKIAQCIHAAGESSPGNLPENTYAVALSVPNEQALLELESELLKAGIKIASIREPDPPYNNQLMGIGIFPCVRSHVKRFLQHLSLVK